MMNTEMTSQKRNGYAVVLLSGGIDSTSCLHFYWSRGFQVEGLFIDYGQPAAIKEAEAAHRVSEFLSLPLRQMRFSGTEIQTLNEIPGRNALFLFAALMSFSASNGIIALGIHAGTSYFDCSQDFTQLAQRLVDGYVNGKIQLGVPFLKWSKLDVWHYLQQIELPTGLTYSCELGLEQPCGKCHSCRDLEVLYASKDNKNRS